MPESNPIEFRNGSIPDAQARSVEVDPGSSLHCPSRPCRVVKAFGAGGRVLAVSAESTGPATTDVGHPDLASVGCSG